MLNNKTENLMKIAIIAFMVTLLFSFVIEMGIPLPVQEAKTPTSIIEEAVNDDKVDFVQVYTTDDKYKWVLQYYKNRYSANMLVEEESGMIHIDDTITKHRFTDVAGVINTQKLVPANRYSDSDIRVHYQDGGEVIYSIPGDTAELLAYIEESL